LGDTLTLLSNALKAGYSFAQAIDTVAKNAVPPIADEFARAVREMNLGGSPDEALSNITKRIASADFDLVATAYSIHRTVGGNLAEILDNIAYTIRERGRIKGEIATLTAQARASGTLITFLPIVLAVFMYFVTPTYFRPMFENFIGWILIAIGIFMIFIGNLIIRRIVAIEVLLHVHNTSSCTDLRGRRPAVLHRHLAHPVDQHGPDGPAASVRLRRREAADG